MQPRTDRRKLQHSETSRECGGDTRGLAGLPHMAAEVLEGYFSSRRIPPEKCGVYTPSWGPQLTAPERKGTQIISICKKQQGFCQPGRECRRCREPFKGPKHKISFAATYHWHLPLALAKGGRSGLEMLE